MAAHRITPAHDPKNVLEFEIVTEDDKIHTLKVKKWNYLPMKVVRVTDAWIKEQNELHEKDERDEAPTNLELMVVALREIDPKYGELVEELSIGEKVQLWEAWQAESKVDMGESKASSDS